MFDARLRPLIDPPLDRLGRLLAGRGISADALTIAGCGLGVAAALSIAAGWFWAALVLFLSGRALDGLDGAVARVHGANDRGGYLDIVLDFVVYAAIPLAFAWHAPAANALPAATLLAAIIVNAAAFFAFAAVAARRGLETTAQGQKSIYFLAGLAEGAETIVVYSAMIIWPGWFAALALAFAGLCALSGMSRMAIAFRTLT
jgi:phosphatidylglycerophosphate synthase